MCGSGLRKQGSWVRPRPCCVPQLWIHPGSQLHGFANGVSGTSAAGLQADGPEQQACVSQQLQKEEERRGILLPQGQHPWVHQGGSGFPGRPCPVQEAGGGGDRHQQRHRPQQVCGGERVEDDALVRHRRQGAQAVEGEGRRVRHHRRSRHVRAGQERRGDQHVRQPPRRRGAQQRGAQGSPGIGHALV